MYIRIDDSYAGVLSDIVEDDGGERSLREIVQDAIMIMHFSRFSRNCTFVEEEIKESNENG